MRLILIRHGQAEASSADGSDFRRALTPAGREKLENTIRRWPVISTPSQAAKSGHRQDPRAANRRGALPLHARRFA